MTRTRTIALTKAGAALVLLPLLGGCVAAVAVPLMALTGILTENTRTRAQIVAELPAANAQALAAMPDRPVAASGASLQLTTLSELPPPSGGMALVDGPWRDFATYALSRANGLANGEAAVSALLTPESVLRFQTRTRPCGAREPAVVIDLDPGAAEFAPVAGNLAGPGVAASVNELRAAGIIVLWVSQASANDVAGVAESLKSSGLDPTGSDPILLVRSEDERKQVLREEANETVCVVAMAGDRRSDFDELFDYLRDPKLETAYDAQLGAGWFLVPGLFESALAPAGEEGGR